MINAQQQYKFNTFTFATIFSVFNKNFTKAFKFKFKIIFPSNDLRLIKQQEMHTLG